MKNDLEREVEGRNDMQRLEKRLLQKEENLTQSRDYGEEEDNLLRKEAEIDKIRHELEELRKGTGRAGKNLGFTSEQARILCPTWRRN